MSRGVSVLNEGSGNGVVVISDESSDVSEALPDDLTANLDGASVSLEALENMIGKMVRGNDDTITTDYDDASGKITISTTLKHDTLEDEDQDTSIKMEKYEDEDQIRLYINGSEEARFDSEGNFDLMGDEIENASISGGTF